MESLHDIGLPRRGAARSALAGNSERAGERAPAGRGVLAGGLLALAGWAWVATALRMAGMDAGPGTDPGTLGFFISAWVPMMAAMMLPAITPMALAYGELHSGARARASARVRPTGQFITGYLAVWGSAGLLAYALLETGRSLDGPLLAWHSAGRWAAAGVLGAAALYQLTPPKQACLTKCRSRRTLLRECRRETRCSGLRAGIEHGAWCLGCCWALMAALFALGAMSVAWMALFSVLIAAERLLPRRTLGCAAVATLLAALALGVAAAPTKVPMLTIPGSPAAMRAMGMSSHERMRMRMPARMGARTGTGTGTGTMSG